MEPAPNLQEGQNYSFKKRTIPHWSKGRLGCKHWQVGADLRKRKERVKNMWLEVLFILIGERVYWVEYLWNQSLKKTAIFRRKNSCIQQFIVKIDIFWEKNLLFLKVGKNHLFPTSHLGIVKKNLLLLAGRKKILNCFKYFGRVLF